MSELIAISRKLARACDKLKFGPPVTHVYNPLVYARAAHEAFVERYGTGEREIVLVGMNPGPFGMAQTGVPFGEVALVRDWMGIDVPVNKPKVEHPKRPVQGFACTRSEVSGARLWGWAKQRFGTADAFFSRFFVINYCPLVFMEESGRNKTPDKLKKEERVALDAVCSAAFRQSIEVLSPRLVIGVGAYAKKRAEVVLDGLDLEIGVVLHPSPASPLANQGWVPRAEADFEKLGVRLP